MSAMVASATRPFSMPSARISSMHVAQAFALLRRQLDQRVPVVRRGERIAAAGAVLEHELDAAPGHDLERGDAARGALRGDAEQLQRRFRRFDAGKRGLDRARPRHQPQHRRGDDAERAFGADEQVFQVVAGIVLLQLVEVVHDAAVGQHHLDAEHMRARDAVRDRRRAAGIGREIAADGAGAFRRQAVADRAGRLRRRPRACAAR